MTRRLKPPSKKKQGGVLMGMRSGVQKVAGAVTPRSAADDDAPTNKRASKTWTLVGNVIWGVLVVVIIVIVLRRCGVIHF